jgi:hypothetical protein
MDYVEHFIRRNHLSRLFMLVLYIPFQLMHFLLMVFCLLLLVLKLVDQRMCVCETEVNYSPTIHQTFVLSAMFMVTTKKLAKVGSFERH